MIESANGIGREARAFIGVVEREVDGGPPARRWEAVADEGRNTFSHTARFQRKLATWWYDEGEREVVERMVRCCLIA